MALEGAEGSFMASWFLQEHLALLRAYGSLIELTALIMS